MNKRMSHTLMAAAIAATYVQPVVTAQTRAGLEVPHPTAPASAALAFVENQGQWDTPARFVARRGAMSASVAPDGLAVRHGQLVFRLAFVDASPDVELVGEQTLPGRRNYFVGADRDGWRTDVPAYAAVLYRNLYDGVDLRLREQDRSLKYDVLVEPGADLDRVVVRCDGVEGLVIGADGSLVMHTAAGAITQPPPRNTRSEAPASVQAVPSEGAPA